MPFSKKRGSGSNIGVCKKQEKKKKHNPAPVSLPEESQLPVENDVKEPPKHHGEAFVSPIARTRKSNRRKLATMTTDGSLGVNDLLEVFLELEELDDKLLRPAVVHGRKKL